MNYKENLNEYLIYAGLTIDCRLQANFKHLKKYFLSIPRMRIILKK